MKVDLGKRERRWLEADCEFQGGIGWWLSVFAFAVAGALIIAVMVAVVFCGLERGA